MTEAQKQARANLPGMVTYFRRIAEDTRHRMWETEYEVVSETVKYIVNKTEYVETDFAKIASYINKIVGREHANGSGWLDFQLRLSYFFRTHNYNSDLNTATGEFMFWKENFS